MLKSVALAAALMAVAVVHAQAQDVHLKTGDLDLRRPEQAQILQQRIASSARDWCAHEFTTGSLLRENGCAERVQAVIVAELPDSMRQAYQVALNQAAKPVIAQIAAR